MLIVHFRLYPQAKVTKFRVISYRFDFLLISSNLILTKEKLMNASVLRTSRFCRCISAESSMLKCWFTQQILTGRQK